MIQIAINKEELKKIIKEAVKETVEEEKVENFFKSIPFVSNQEMEEINKLYGKPAEKKEPAYSEEMEV